MFRLVLVMVPLAVQMAGAVGAAAVVRGRGMRWGTRIQVVAPPVARLVRVMWASVDGVAFRGVAEGGVGGALRVGAGDARIVVGDVLVVSACGSRSQVVNMALPPVRLVQVVSVRAASSLMPPVGVVSVTVRLMLLVRAVRLSC